MDRDMGRGLHILLNAAVTGRDPTRRLSLLRFRKRLVV